MDEQKVELQEKTVIDEAGNEQSYTAYRVNSGGGIEGKAIASLVLGILGILSANIVTAILALPMGIVGIVLGQKARRLTAENPQRGRGIATGGFICSIIATVLAGIFLLCLLLVTVGVVGSWDGWMLYDEGIDL